MSAEVFAFLFYGGIALLLALAVVAVQVTVQDLESRFGDWLVVLFPPMVVLGIMLTAAFSGRSLKFTVGDSVLVGGGDVVWVTRLMSALLLSMAFARVFATWSRRRHARLAAAVPTDGARALYLSFVAYLLAAAVCPMVLSAHPSPTYKGLIPLMCFWAVYVSRDTAVHKVIASARWSLLALMLGSLLAAALAPNLALQPDYGGGLPGLRYRLWGLAYHANGLGALALLLLLLQVLQRSRSRWANALIWGAGLAVFVLAQSKTVWLAGLVALLLILGYRWGRGDDGRPRAGLVLLAVALPGLAAFALLMAGPAELFDKLARQSVSSGASTLTGRTDIWNAALTIWQESPVFGYGLEAWDLRNRLSLGLPAAVHAHNQLLQALSTGGLLAAAGLLGFVFFLCRAAWRHARATGGVSLAILAMILLRSLSEPPLELGSMLSGEVLTLMLLLLLCLQKQPAAERRPAAAGALRYAA